MNNFENELQELINRYNREAGSDTPDFILAQYMQDSLATFNRATNRRDQWYGFSPQDAFTVTPIVD
jgi:hypothetical protein